LITNASSYWPGNYYNNTTFIWWASFDWASPQNDNLWWSWWTTLQRQGPCTTWYYIPTQTEWAGIVTAGWWGTNWISMQNTLLLPFAGLRDLSTGAMNYQTTIAYYWSTTLTSTYAYTLIFNASSINPANSRVRAYGFSLRCFKN
jgi:hypothetical protein